MDSYRITPGWLPVMSLHGSTAVTIDGRGFSSASPTSRLFAHFRLSGSEARWHAAKMAAVGSAHFRLQKHSSETYEWRHGHYVHVFYSLWKWHTRESVKMHVSAGILVNTVAYGLGEGKLLRK